MRTSLVWAAVWDHVDVQELYRSSAASPWLVGMCVSRTEDVRVGELALSLISCNTGERGTVPGEQGRTGPSGGWGGVCRP